MMDRRTFMSHLGISSIISSKLINTVHKDYTSSVLPDWKQAKAVAMWDYSWLLRKYPGGGFEDWEQATSELLHRGYNTLRIDCFPQFIADSQKNEAKEEYFLPKRAWRPSLWGNEISITISPRRDLLDFLLLCKRKNIDIILSSWFQGHGTNRNNEFVGVEGLVSSWSQTLSLLQENDLLKNVLYVDILNEYPLWHGYRWLHQELNKIQQFEQQFDFLNKKQTKRFNAEQIRFYNRFLKEAMISLKSQWPELRFSASQTCTLNTDWKDLDLKYHDIIDSHLWMVYNQPFSRHTGYFDQIHILKNDINFKKTLTLIDQYWNKNKALLTKWLEGEIKDRVSTARSLNLKIGNTEGWGAVMWMDHPYLNWDFIKECGLIGAQIGAKYKYSFNCSSNFTHPHFALWDDIEWHQKVTTIIKGG